MKLFVVGESTPDPSQWSVWSEYALVLAETPEKAEEMTSNSPATEIPLDEPLYLIQQTEPNWGEDI